MTRTMFLPRDPSGPLRPATEPGCTQLADAVPGCMLCSVMSQQRGLDTAERDACELPSPCGLSLSKALRQAQGASA